MNFYRPSIAINRILIIVPKNDVRYSLVYGLECILSVNSGFLGKIIAKGMNDTIHSKLDSIADMTEGMTDLPIPVKKMANHVSSLPSPGRHG